MRTWKFHFTNHHIARRFHQCTTCRRDIGPGDCYKRSAIPPWGYEDVDTEARYSIGVWAITRECYDCY